MNKRKSFAWCLGIGFALASVATGAAAVAPTHSGQPMLVRAAHSFGNGFGWASDGRRVMATSDDGAHWRDITPPHAALGVEKVFFVDANDGWAAVRDATAPDHVLDMLATSDAGASWVALPTVPTRVPGAYVDSAQFTASGYGWLMLRLPSSSNFNLGRLLTTHDGGATWTRQPIPPTAGALSFSSPRDGRLTADAGHPGAYVSHDGGASWQRVAQTNAARADAMMRASAALAGRLAPGEAVVHAQLRSDGSGWIVVGGGSCAKFKTQCSQHTKLFAVDGGGNVTDVTPRLLGTVAAPQLVERSQNQLGFDKCAAASISATEAWWSNTPWNWTNIYIGGSNMGCSQGNLDSGWVSAILATGFTLVPTWVGPQAHGSVCSSCGLMSSNTATAYQQGIDNANAATNAASALGLHPPTIIYYDMESYSPRDNAAANAFINGWVKGMHDNGNQAGVYSSPYNLTYYSGIDNVPDAVWLASWNGSSSVFGISGISDSKWANHQRIHQYRGGHNDTYNGVTFNIDTNSSDGLVAGGDCTVTGHITAKYNALGGVNSVLGRCTTDTDPAQDSGQYNHFQNGSIYWSSATGAHEIHGAISTLWNSLQWEIGPLGFPTTDETSVGDGVGRYNNFQHGAIYWTPTLHAHEVYGAIFTLWNARDRTRSCLGYPTSGQYTDGNVQRNDFQRGKITWSSTQGAVATCTDRIFANNFDD